MKKNLPSSLHQGVKILIAAGILEFLSLHSYSQDWNNCGGMSSRNGLANVPGPASPDILWQGTQTGLFGMPVFIEGNVLVTTRFVSLTNSPVVCHDLNTGDILWTADVTNGTGRSVPIGIKDGKVYVMRFLEGSEGDSLVALNASTGEHLWIAQELIRPATMVGCVFEPGGDLIVEGNFKLLRIDATDGSTVWSAPVYPWVLGWLCPVIFENTVYVQQNDLESIVALDLNTGEEKYTQAVDPLGANAQTELMVGTDGLIYAHTTGPGGQITSLKDDGDSLSVLWTTPVSGYAVFCYLAESPDSTIYAPSNGKIVRLLKSTGAIIDSTASLGSPGLFIAMVTVGSDGKVYIATENTFQCTNPDLTPIFTETIPGINTCGGAIGPKNTIAIAGSGTELRVYKSLATSAQEELIQKSTEVTLQPNPAREHIVIHASEKIKQVECMNYFGQGQTIILNNNMVDISRLSSGFYFLRITTDEKIITKGFVKE